MPSRSRDIAFRSAGSVLAGIALMHRFARASSRSTAPMQSRSPPNLMRWQEWSFQFEGQCAIRGKSRRPVRNATEPPGILQISLLLLNYHKNYFLFIFFVGH